MTPSLAVQLHVTIAATSAFGGQGHSLVYVISQVQEPLSWLKTFADC